MSPWKRFVGSVGVVALLTAGTFAAGADVVPFRHASESTAPADVDEEAPADDSVDGAGEDTSTTTTTTTESDTDTPGPDPDTDPDSDADDTDDGDEDGDGDEEAPPVVVVDVPSEPAPSDAPPAPEADEVPPAVPAENDAPVVCAAAAESECGPAEAAPPADATFESRVQRCQDWWNRLADRLDDRKPRWAERARRVSERCEAMAARWQEKHDRWHGKHDRKVKGDHNCDGHPDNGWHRKDRPECPAPPAPAERPASQKAAKEDRPQAAPERGKKSR